MNSRKSFLEMLRFMGYVAIVLVILWEMFIIIQTWKALI